MDDFLILRIFYTTAQILWSYYVVGLFSFMFVCRYNDFYALNFVMVDRLF